MTEKFNEGVPDLIDCAAISPKFGPIYIFLEECHLTVPEARELRAWLDTVIPKGSTGDGGVKHD